MFKIITAFLASYVAHLALVTLAHKRTLELTKISKHQSDAKRSAAYDRAHEAFLEEMRVANEIDHRALKKD